MTISDELETLMQTKKNLKKAITNKGVSIPSGTPFAAYPDAINAISGEGGSFVDLSNYATKDYVDDAISNIELIPGPQGPQGEQGPAGKDADPVDLEGYATEDFVMEAIANIEVSGGGDVDLTGYVTEEELQNTIGDINTVLDVINGEIIPDDTEEVNALLDDINGEVI